MGLSVSGLYSGLDPQSIVSQLIASESQPKTLLQNQLSTVQTTAAAYRDLNTSFATLATAAQALTTKGLAATKTASSTSTSVAGSATSTAVDGSSVTFSVTQLAGAQTSVSAGTWSSASGDVRTAAATGSGSPLPGWPLSIYVGGTLKDTIDPPAGASLYDVAALINKGTSGLTATVVQLDSTDYKLQITSPTTGSSNGFKLLGPTETDPTAPGPGSAFVSTHEAQDATLTLEDGSNATSSSNTFSNLITGVSVTVSATTTAPVTVSVGADDQAITDKVQALVDAANAVLTKIGKYTDESPNSKAALKGDYTTMNLAQQVLSTVTKAIGDITFDKTAFAKQLAADPALAQSILGGSTKVGADGIANSADDAVDVDGLAARLSVLADRASDSTSGLLTSMAKSQDTQAGRLQDQIDAWTTRLADRQTALTKQYTALQTALASLQTQQTWLTSQFESLSGKSSSN